MVRHPAYVEGLSEAVTLAPGGEAHVKVTLYAGGSLEGRVVDENKRPVGGARIDLVAIRGTLERSTVSADDGSFAFAAVPKEVALSVARPDDTLSVALREEVSVGEGEKNFERDRGQRQEMLDAEAIHMCVGRIDGRNVKKVAARR